MSNDLITEVVDERKSVYGDPKVSFPMVALVWSGILGTEVRPDQVPLLLMGYKLVRTSETPEYSDNSDDVEGYLEIFRLLMEDKMIHARSVTEFIEKRKASNEQAAADSSDGTRYSEGELAADPDVCGLCGGTGHSGGFCSLLAGS